MSMKLHISIIASLSALIGHCRSILFIAYYKQNRYAIRFFKMPEALKARKVVMSRNNTQKQVRKSKKHKKPEHKM